MKAKFINEIQNFERGLNPKESMGIGIPEAKILDLERINQIVDNYKGPKLFCLYRWEPDSDTSYYYINLNEAYEKFIKFALESAKIFNDEETISQHLVVYSIDPTKNGLFIDEREPQSFDGVNILFGIEFSGAKIYHI